MTQDIGAQLYGIACCEQTLPRDDGSSQSRGWTQGTQKFDLCWKSWPVACMANMELRLEFCLWVKTILTPGLEFLLDLLSKVWPNSVSPGNMSHWGTPPFNDHLDHCFIVFEHTQQNFLTRRLDVWRNTINILQHVDLPSRFLTSFSSTSRIVLSEVGVTFPKTETMRSHNPRAGKPSNFNPVSTEIISDFVELCETAVYFSHIQFLGTNVWLPKMHNFLQEVDFESSRSLLKSQSGNNPSLHCFAKNNTVCIHMCDGMTDIRRHKCSSQALVHFVMDLARISSLPCRPKYNHFRTIWKQIQFISPTDFISI